MAEQLRGQMVLFDFVEEEKPQKTEKPKKQDIDILTFLNTGSEHAVKRKRLCCLTHLSDRTMRNLLHDAGKKIPIINLQNGKGYFIPDMNLSKDRKLLARWVKQEESRIKERQLCVDTAIKTLNNCGVDWR